MTVVSTAVALYVLLSPTREEPRYDAHRKDSRGASKNRTERSFDAEGEYIRSDTKTVRSKRVLVVWNDQWAPAENNT